MAFSEQVHLAVPEAKPLTLLLEKISSLFLFKLS